MSATDAFFDTNVLLYLVSLDIPKAERAEELLRNGGVVSVQVLMEFADVSSRKFQTPWPRIMEVLRIVRSLCRVDDFSVETYERGLRVAQRYRYRIYDSMILAAAIVAGCKILFSEDMQNGQLEDMQNGQLVESVRIQNPFSRS